MRTRKESEFVVLNFLNCQIIAPSYALSSYRPNLLLEDYILGMGYPYVLLLGTV